MLRMGMGVWPVRSADLTHLPLSGGPLGRPGPSAAAEASSALGDTFRYQHKLHLGACFSLYALRKWYWALVPLQVWAMHFTRNLNPSGGMAELSV